MKNLKVGYAHFFKYGNWGITILPKLSIARRIYFIREVVLEIHFEWLFWSIQYNRKLKEDWK